jgi:receptor protein-tyrosine kinase
MSLIEQAAQRLETLRRAGADVAGLPPATQSAGGDGQPTPEAIMHALDARGSPLVAPQAPLADRPPARSAEVDFRHLAAQGYLTPESPKTQLADEYRVIKRPLLRNAFAPGASAKNRNLVMITSALPAEGKSFTALNLAMSMAMEVNHTVLLVDGDVANPSLPGLLGVPSEPGMLDLLCDPRLSIADTVIQTNIEKLSVMPSGSRHRRATELLASQQMANLMRELARDTNRIVIFDSPPLLPTTEARALATHVGQIVMVVAAEATRQQEVAQALATVESCEIVLMLLNKTHKTDVGAYYGYYPAGNE